MVNTTKTIKRETEHKDKGEVDKCCINSEVEVRSMPPLVVLMLRIRPSLTVISCRPLF